MAMPSSRTGTAASRRLSRVFAHTRASTGFGRRHGAGTSKSLSSAIPASGQSDALASSPQRIIDCHVHFYDPWRPGHSGLGDGEGLHHRTCLTAQALALCGHEGVEGAVLVECSAPVEDNQWLLDLSDSDEFIVGVVGHIEPGPSFRTEIDRFAQHPRFCGIRASGCSVAELTHLRDSGLQLDHIGGPPASIRDLCRQLKYVPGLRVVINHMAQPGPFAAVTTGEGAAASAAAAPQPTAEWLATINAAAEIDSIYMKVSAVFEAAPGDINAPAPITLDYYQPHLEALWEAFGSDRLIYGSNWPVCDRCGDPETVYGQQLAVLRQFFGGKGQDAVENYFWRNALRAYKYTATENHVGSWYTHDKQQQQQTTLH